MSYLAYCPTGTVFAFAGSSAPNGWLLCDGSAVSRTTYSQLFSAIGSANGSGDGSTTFNIPDLRGRFLRGVSGSSTIDPDKSLRIAMNSGGNTGNAVGSVQGIATSIASGTQGGTKSTAGISNQATTVPTTNINLNHNHGWTGTTITTYGSGGTTGKLCSGDNNVWSTFTPQGTVGTTNMNANHDHTIASGGISFNYDNETRPVNAYVNYIIKV